MPPKPKILKVYTDGGSRGNPGLAGCAFVVCDRGRVKATGARFIGDSLTNNEAEYRGVIDGMKAAAEHTKGPIILMSDSRLVVNQMTGKWRIHKMHLRKLYYEGVTALQVFESVTFKWVPRSHKRIMLADSLLNQELDRVEFEHIKRCSGIGEI